MSARTKSKKSIIFIWIIACVVVIGIAAQLFLSYKVKSALAEQLPKNITLDYADVSTNVFMGNIALKNVELNTTDGNTQVLANKLAVKSIGYLSLLSGNTVELGEIHLDEPKIVLKQQPSDTLKEPTSPPDNAPKLLIKKVKVDQGEITIRNTRTDSVLLSAKAIDINLSQLELDPKSTSDKPPFTLEDYEFAAQDLYFDVSPYEFMRCNQVQLSNEMGAIENIQFQSKYSPEKLATLLSVQHDHFDVTVDKIQITKPDIFGNSGPKLFTPLLEVHSPKIMVRRNTMLTPNTIIKKMPNQMLREMSAELKIDSLSVTDGEVNFYKKTMPDVEPHKMALTSINSQIKNLNNTGDGIVVVTGQHQVMGDGNFTLEYTFDPQSEDNSFLAKMSMSDFHTKKISPFMRSTLDVEVDGTIQQMYYTIDGNEWTSRGEMKMKYDQFKFMALKKDHLTVNKFKSGVANLLTKKGDRKADEDGFRHGQFEVDRDRTKWVLNYIWINMRTGMFHTMVGSGKEK